MCSSDLRGVVVAFEAAVAGGIPIIKALREGLTANQIQWVAGIINGTTNFILSEMRDKGADFGPLAAALAGRVVRAYLTGPAGERMEAALAEQLREVQWTREAIQAAFKQVLGAHSLKMPQLAIPVRLLVFGLAQTLRGAHHPSHTLWTAWLCAAVGVAVAVGASAGASAMSCRHRSLPSQVSPPASCSSRR